jgi:hypothetical protein
MAQHMRMCFGDVSSSLLREVRQTSRPVQTGGVGSKYEDFWAGQLPLIHAQVLLAAAGGSAVVGVPDLTRLGTRQSWYGMAEVGASRVQRPG